MREEGVNSSAAVRKVAEIDLVFSPDLCPFE
jgi:hypothetical protein